MAVAEAYGGRRLCCTWWLPRPRGVESVYERDSAAIATAIEMLLNHEH
ncbi:MAG: hypothetical protein IPM24_28415, partial [Bryobacterales bacterium]|nr:hypothetical protein [Bryobacterales bacterium]